MPQAWVPSGPACQEGWSRNPGAVDSAMCTACDADCAAGALGIFGTPFDAGSSSNLKKTQPAIAQGMSFVLPS